VLFLNGLEPSHSKDLVEADYVLMRMMGMVENYGCRKSAVLLKTAPPVSPPKKTSLSLLCLCLVSTLAAQDVFLPLPEAGMEMSVLNQNPGEKRFLKPTKSIKPPAANPVIAATTAQPQVHAPTVARLRRLILMPGGLTPEAMREQIAANGQNRQPVTFVGMDATAQVLSKLASLFGSDVNEDTQKKVVETVRQGLDESVPSKTTRRVEVVGWLPSEGVMAVAVYPES
jgi:hypothetical protein